MKALRPPIGREPNLHGPGAEVVVTVAGRARARLDSVGILQPLTADRAALERAVRSTAALGKTALHTAVYIALKQFGQRARSAGAPRRQAIVLLSDGADTSSPMSLEDVLKLARGSGVSVYTVSLQSRETLDTPAARIDTETSDRALRTLARETGGASFFPTTGELKSVYRSIATELASQYSIGYVPVDDRLDSRFRRIVVQVLTGAALRPRTRLGYTTDDRER